MPGVEEQENGEKASKAAYLMVKVTINTIVVVVIVSINIITITINTGVVVIVSTNINTITTSTVVVFIVLSTITTSTHCLHRPLNHDDHQHFHHLTSRALLERT